MKEFIDKLIERLEEELIPLNQEITKYFYELKDTDNPKYIYAVGRSNALTDFKYTIKQLAEEYKVSEIPTGWITCSERLPELTEGTECFKQSKCCLVALKWWDGDITESVAWYNQSGVWNEDSKNCKVIAWMPLPAPYTEGE